MIKKLLFFVVFLSVHLGMCAQSIDSYCCSDAHRSERVKEIELALADIENTIILDLAMQSPKITVVPEQVSALVNLKCLDLSFNRVSSFPKSFVDLQSLECLDLSGNHYLQQVPSFFKEMPNLKVVKLEDLNWSESKKEKTCEQFPDIIFVF